jgi:hypothetical protein
MRGFDLASGFGFGFGDRPSADAFLAEIERRRSRP